MLDLYKNIRKRRIELGLSQQKLAEMTGYTDRSSIAKIESGSVDLSESKIKLFSEALHISASDLMGFPEQESDDSSDTDILARYPGISRETVERFSPLLEQLSHDDLEKVYEFSQFLLSKEQEQKGEDGS